MFIARRPQLDTNAADALVARLAAEGVATNTAALHQLADDARERGVSEILVSVMVDDREPIAPRVRAYGRVSARLAALQSHSLLVAS